MGKLESEKRQPKLLKDSETNQPVKGIDYIRTYFGYGYLSLSLWTLCLDLGLWPFACTLVHSVLFKLAHNK